MPSSVSQALHDSVHFRNKEELVHFHNVQPQYLPEGDATVTYSLGSRVTATPLDWIGIFRSEWRETSQPLTFQWAPLSSQQGNKHFERFVTFPSKLIQPLEHTEGAYQFMYINNYNQIIGASHPFFVRREHDRGDIDVINSSRPKSGDSQSDGGDEGINDPESPILISFEDEWECRVQNTRNKLIASSSYSDLSDIVILSNSPSQEACKRNLGAEIIGARKNGKDEHEIVRPACPADTMTGNASHTEASAAKACPNETSPVNSDDVYASNAYCNMSSAASFYPTVASAGNPYPATDIAASTYHSVVNTANTYPNAENIFPAVASSFKSHPIVATTNNADLAEANAENNYPNELNSAYEVASAGNSFPDLTSPKIACPFKINKQNVTSSMKQLVDRKDNTMSEILKEPNPKEDPVNINRETELQTTKESPLNGNDESETSPQEEDSSERLKPSSRRKIKKIKNHHFRISTSLLKQLRIIHPETDSENEEEVMVTEGHHGRCSGKIGSISNSPEKFLENIIVMPDSTTSDKSRRAVSCSGENLRETKVQISKRRKDASKRVHKIVCLSKNLAKNTENLDHTNKAVKERSLFCSVFVQSKTGEDATETPTTPQLENGCNIFIDTHNYPNDEDEVNSISLENGNEKNNEVKEINIQHTEQTIEVLAKNNIVEKPSESQHNGHEITKHTEEYNEITNIILEKPQIESINKEDLSVKYPIFEFKAPQNKTDQRQRLRIRGKRILRLQQSFQTRRKVPLFFSSGGDTELTQSKEQITLESSCCAGEVLSQLLQDTTEQGFPALTTMAQPIEARNEPMTQADSCKPKKPAEISESCGSKKARDTSSSIRTLPHSFSRGRFAEEASSFYKWFGLTNGPSEREVGWAERPPSYASIVTASKNDLKQEKDVGQTTNCVNINIPSREQISNYVEPYPNTVLRTKSASGNKKLTKINSEQIAEAEFKEASVPLKDLADSTIHKKTEAQNFLKKTGEQRQSEYGEYLVEDQGFAACELPQECNDKKEWPLLCPRDVNQIAESLNKLHDSIQSPNGKVFSKETPRKEPEYPVSMKSIEECSQKTISALQTINEHLDHTSKLTWPLPTFRSFSAFTSSDTQNKIQSDLQARTLKSFHKNKVQECPNYPFDFPKPERAMTVPPNINMLTRNSEAPAQHGPHVETPLQHERDAVLERALMTSLAINLELRQKQEVMAAELEKLRTASEHPKNGEETTTPEVSELSNQQAKVVRHRRMPLIKGKGVVKSIIRFSEEIQCLRAQVKRSDILIKELTMQLEALKDAHCEETEENEATVFGKDPQSFWKHQISASRPDVNTPPGYVQKTLTKTPCPHIAPSSEFSPKCQFSGPSTCCIHGEEGNSVFINCMANSVSSSVMTSCCSKPRFSYMFPFRAKTFPHACQTADGVSQSCDHTSYPLSYCPRYKEHELQTHRGLHPRFQDTKRRNNVSFHPRIYNTENHNHIAFHSCCEDKEHHPQPTRYLLSQDHQKEDESSSESLKKPSLTCPTCLPDVCLCTEDQEIPSSQPEQFPCYYHISQASHPFQHSANTQGRSSPNQHLGCIQHSHLSCNNSRNRSRDNSTSDPDKAFLQYSLHNSSSINPTYHSSFPSQAEPSVRKPTDETRLNSIHENGPHYVLKKYPSATLHSYDRQHLSEAEQSVSLGTNTGKDSAIYWISNSTNISQDCFPTVRSANTNNYPAGCSRRPTIKEDAPKIKGCVAPFCISGNSPDKAMPSIDKMFAFASVATICPRTPNDSILANGPSRWWKPSCGDNGNNFQNTCSSTPHILSEDQKFQIIQQIENYRAEPQPMVVERSRSPLYNYQSCFLRELGKDEGHKTKLTKPYREKNNILQQDSNNFEQDHEQPVINEPQQERKVNVPRKQYSIPPSELPYPPLSPFHHPSKIEFNFTKYMKNPTRNQQATQVNDSYFSEDMPKTGDLINTFCPFLNIPEQSNAVTNSLYQPSQSQELSSTSLHSQRSTLEISHSGLRIIDKDNSSVRTCPCHSSILDNRQIEENKACHQTRPE